MARCKGTAAAEAKVEELKRDDEWVEVAFDPDWVFVNPVRNERNHEGGEGPDGSCHDAAGFAPTLLYRSIHNEESDVDDNNEGQNTQRTQTNRETVKERDIDEGADACVVDADSRAHGFSNRVSDKAHGFFQAACEDDDKIAHVFSYESGLSEGSFEDDNDEDAYGNLDYVESARGCSESAFKDVDVDVDVDGVVDVYVDDDDEDEDDEEEEEEEEDEYSYALHEEALQDEVNKHTNSLMDAMERYHTNPVRECSQEYICSVQTETRRELHEAKMVSFRGYGPLPRSFIKGSKYFNPVFEEMWLPWAINTEYCHDEDMGLLVWDGATGLTQCALAAQLYMSSAVPIQPVLEYMVNRTPRKKIAHIGSCSSLYWAALLQQLGATNVIVTESSYPVTVPVTCVPAGYPHIEQIEEEMFNMAVGQALFLLRPSKRSSDAEPCMAERCLFCFPGDTIFFVGECGKHADNFNMAQWVEEHALEGWRVEKEMEIPCWPGSHDVFLCITKVSLPVNITT